MIAGNAAGQNVAPPLHLSCLKMSKFEFSYITGFTSQLLPDRDFATYTPPPSSTDSSSAPIPADLPNNRVQQALRHLSEIC